MYVCMYIYMFIHIYVTCHVCMYIDSHTHTHPQVKAAAIMMSEDEGTGCHGHGGGGLGGHQSDSACMMLSGDAAIDSNIVTPRDVKDEALFAQHQEALEALERFPSVPSLSRSISIGSLSVFENFCREFGMVETDTEKEMDSEILQVKVGAAAGGGGGGRMMTAVTA